MNKKREIKKSKFYMAVVVVALIGLMVGSLIYYMHILDETLAFQQNVIGILSQKDEAYAELYLHTLFEPINDTNIEKGNKALEQYGFTETGILYIGKNMGLWKSSLIGSGLLLLSGGMILFLLYKMMKLQKEEMQILEQELFMQKQERMKEEYLEKQNQRIQSFIENIAHQMKTPLSRVFSSLDIVEDSISDEKQKQHVEDCYLHLESMNVLIRKLMDIGKLEAGKVIFQKKKVCLKELLEDVKHSCTKDTSRIKIDIEENKADFYGDEKWLKEAFSNIICNALEADFEERPVEIEGMDSGDFVKISIRDYGKGLSEKDIPNIFDRFYLPENVKESHTGIGLNLARLIIEGHNGSVYVYNHCEGGAVFQVLLPKYESLKVREL